MDLSLKKSSISPAVLSSSRLKEGVAMSRFSRAMADSVCVSNEYAVRCEIMFSGRQVTDVLRKDRSPFGGLSALLLVKLNIVLPQKLLDHIDVDTLTDVQKRVIGNARFAAVDADLAVFHVKTQVQMAR